MTTLIKNIILVDGTGMSPFKADVLVRDEKIMAVGSFPNYKADETINGNENYLVPGFIDTDITSDRYLTLFKYPRHKNFLIQGVTSAIIGQCGFSLAPNFYGSVGHLYNWANINHFNISWRSVSEFLSAIEKLKLGINIGTLVGHKVIRENIIKDIDTKFRRLSANELRVFISVVEKSMKQGAFGLSSGLEYDNYKKTTFNELQSILGAVKKYGGIYTTHLKNEREGLVESVEDTIKISKSLMMTTIISHLRAFKGYEKEYKKAIDIIKNEIVNADVYFDINPFTMSAMPISALIEDIKDDNAVIVEKIKDKKFLKEFVKRFAKINGKKIVILNAPGMEFLNGKTLYDFAKNREISMPFAIAKLMEITQMRAVILYDNLNRKITEDMLLNERSLISTNSNNFDIYNSPNIPKRAVDTFPEFLRIADKNGMNIESAILKITGLPAKILGISNRGSIAGGSFADMVLLNNDMKIANVMVNGKWSVRDGELLDKSPNGSVLKFSKLKR